MQSNDIVFCGIDPGYDRCGVACVRRHNGTEELLYSTCILSDKTLSFEERLLQIINGISTVFDTYEPGVLSLETLFLGTNHKTAMRVAEVRGALLYIAALRHMAIREFSPPEIKRAITGDGRADKRQVTNMVPKLISLPTTPTYDDEYDAIAIALCASATHRATM